jgi:hypothetical protein
MTAHSGGSAFYDFHGVGIEVAGDGAIAAAMELRLRDFAGGDARSDVRLEFVNGAGVPPSPSGAGRPVYDTPHGTLHYFASGDELLGTLAGVSMRCSAARGAVLIGGRSLTGFELYLATHPLATIALMETMERRGLFSLHAACLTGASGAGALLAGPSGAGKSTLTIALARAGLALLSDDVVFLSVSGERVDALGFADTLGVGSFAAERFPELRAVADSVPAEGFPKRLSRIEDLFGAASAPRCTPRAIVFPEVSLDRPSAIAPLDPGEAMLRLVPDVLLTEPASTQAHLAAISVLLGQVDCFALRSGTDLERAAELVAELVA